MSERPTDRTPVIMPPSDSQTELPRLLWAASGATALRCTQQRLTIGRDSACHLVVDDAQASRRHAILLWRDGVLRIQAWQNRNPVLVNGMPVESETLRPGDRVIIGHSEFTVAFAPTPARYSDEDLTRELRLTRDHAADLAARHHARGDFHAITTLLARLDGPDSVIDAFAALCRERWAPDRGVVVRFKGEGAALLAGFGAQSNAPVSRWALDELRRGGAALRLDRGDNPQGSSASMDRLAIRSLIAAPLFVRGSLWGAVALDSRDPARDFSSGDLEALAALAQLTGLLVEHATRHRELAGAHQRLAERLGQAGIIAESPAMEAALALGARVAPTDLGVLLLGESGVGKEVLARLVHEQSRRADNPFVAVNAGALAPTLVESELFGHVRGSFTGADRDHVGLFRRADGGTLFLDEIGDMPADVQAKLLRALQEGRIRPIGGVESPVDLRIIAATNRNLQEAITQGEFREDLYYRLAAFEIEIPPLRERPEDILPLARHFARLYAGTEVALDDRACRALTGHAWPGNVRELQHAVQRAVLLGDGRSLRAEDFAFHTLPDAEVPTLIPSLDEVERRHLLHVLRETRGNKSQAAEILGINRDTLYRKMDRHGIARDFPASLA